MIRVLFVCLGNICRSPLAEGVFRRLAAERRLSDRIQVDSAGTGGWHAGDPPDRRMRATAQRRGVSLEGIRARRVERRDLKDFDYVFAMDRQNLRDLESLVGSDDHSPLLFRFFDPDSDSLDVPDPYYGGPDGFERVFEIVERTCRSILDHICRVHGISTNESEADMPSQSQNRASA